MYLSNYIKCLLLLVLLHASCFSFAQYQKVPDINHERNEVNQQMLKGKHKGYRVYDLEMRPDNILDTSTVSDFKYNTSGLLVEMLTYKYGSYEEVKELKYGQLLSRYQQGARIYFQYDAKGNMLSKRSIMLFPANSYMALMMVLMNANKKGEPLQEPEAMLKAGVPEQHTAREMLTYKYDKSGNVLSSFDSVRNATNIYRYEYDLSKRVRSQRITTYEELGTKLKLVAAFHFNYYKDNLLDTITAYRTFMDTVHITDVRNRQYKVIRSYNSVGKVVLEQTTSQNGSPTETIFTFQDTLCMGSITCRAYTSHDTEAIATISYDAQRRAIEEQKVTFYQGARHTSDRKEYTYDSEGNVTEICYYTRAAAGTKETMNRKIVFEIY